MKLRRGELNFQVSKIIGKMHGLFFLQLFGYVCFPSSFFDLPITMGRFSYYGSKHTWFHLFFSDPKRKPKIVTQ